MSSIKISDKDIFTKIGALRDQLAPLENQLKSRLDYLIRTVYEICKTPIDGWYVEEAEEGGLGDVFSIFTDDAIDMSYLVTYGKNHPSEPAAILDNKEWYLFETIPKQWLFEDFEEELREGVHLYNQKEKERLNNAKKFEIKDVRTNEIVGVIEAEVNFEFHLNLEKALADFLSLPSCLDVYLEGLYEGVNFHEFAKKEMNVIVSTERYVVSMLK